MTRMIPAHAPRPSILLGVNIDHVATVRQARRGGVPSLAEAAAAAVAGGADGITVHLREDRRHIQDDDVRLLAPKYRLNLEMAATPEMILFATADPKPHSVCLVPEKRQELTTEGGLDVASNTAAIKDAVAELKRAGVIVSLFVDPDPWQIEAAAAAGADFIELHTGAWARACGSAARGESELRDLLQGATTGRRLGLRINAGHGLDLSNVAPVLGMEGLEELNIGFSIVARALFVGLERAVREMKDAMS